MCHRSLSVERDGDPHRIETPTTFSHTDCVWAGNEICKNCVTVRKLEVKNRIGARPNLEVVHAETSLVKFRPTEL